MIDSHSHINSKVVKNIEQIIDKINTLKQLKSVINVGIDKSTSLETIQLSQKYDKFYSVIGIHPLKEGSLTDIYQLYHSNYNKKIVGIGETGIDYLGDIKKQTNNFIESIKLANQLKLPLVIHANNTNELVLKIIKKYQPQYGFVFHCFQPDLDSLKKILKMDGYISLGTPITKKNAKKSLEVIKNVDIHHLMIELDYPYMTNNVLNIEKVLDKILKQRYLEKKELESILDNNTKRFFKIKR